MTAYNAGRLAAEVASLAAPAPNATVRGRRLQDLVEWLIGEVAGVDVTAKNLLNVAQSEEKDLWLRHMPHVSGLPFRDTDVPIECKNEGRKTSAAEVRDFAAKIADSGGIDGLLITRKGLSGKPSTAGHHAITLALAQGRRITVVTVADLAVLMNTDQLVALLIDRQTELRQLQTYRSI